jgi:hypothetical protein
MKNQLEIVKAIQKQYPLAIVGGSVGLYIHGIRLSRWKNDKSDIDIIVPYYHQFAQIGNRQTYNREDKQVFSGSDFSDNCFIIWDSKEYKIEIAIDPFSKYEIRDGFKVNPLDVIWQYKLKYNKQKHKDDLKEAMIKSFKQVNDIPF